MNATSQPGLIFHDRRFLNVAEVWFHVPTSYVGIDIVYLYQIAHPIQNAVQVCTLLLDLTMPIEDLLSRLKKDARYKINRADARDGLIYEVYIPSQLSPSSKVLVEFAEFYKLFSGQKGLASVELSYLNAMAVAGVLWLTSVRKDGHPLVWHSYVATNGRVRLRHSASHYRTEGSEIKNLVGRANRWLHWRDMQMFREQGFRSYDFGGVVLRE